MKQNFSCCFLFVLFFFSSCGEITTNTTRAPTPTQNNPATDRTPATSADLNHPAGNTAIVLGANFTDPVGSLNLLSINSPHTAATNLQTTHSDASVYSFGNQLYVVNHLGADNIQIVNPTNFSVTKQCSVGRGTNPQQIIVTASDKAFVSLYQPDQNSSMGLHVDDLIVVNPSADSCNDFITHTIDLTPLTTDDGDRFARASAMVMIEKNLYVALQDLPGDLSHPANQLGKIAVIDAETNEIIRTIGLQGRNPVAMDYSPITKRIYVGDVDYFYSISDFGGIEVVNPETSQSEGFLISKTTLGGSPADMEVYHSKGFVAVGLFDAITNTYGTKVVSFNLTPNSDLELNELYRSAGYIQDIAVDQNGILLIGDQHPTVNGILFVDPVSHQVVGGPIHLGAAPSSITFIERGS